MKTKIKRNLGALPPTDRRFYRPTKEFFHQLQGIYRQTHEEFGVSHPLNPPLAMPLLSYETRWHHPWLTVRNIPLPLNVLAIF